MRFVTAGSARSTSTAELLAAYHTRGDQSARLRVIEQIVTDRGLETASQIEALRDRKRIANNEEA